MRIRSSCWQILGVLLLSLASTACTAGSEPVSGISASITIDDASRAAERDWGVPRNVLLAVGWLETRLSDPATTHTHDGEFSAHAPAVVGPIGLRKSPRGFAAMERVATSVDVDHDVVLRSPGLATVAAAIELHDLAMARFGAVPAAIDHASWAAVAADYVGLDEPTDRSEYAAMLARVVSRGFDVVASNGERLRVEAMAFGGDEVRARTEALSAEYPSATWSAASSSNYSAGRRGESIEYILIHTMQGSYSGSISWFKNASAGASAHYMVRSSDGVITQMVSEANTGWHAGNGTYNRRSIGIEHEGYIEAPDRWYTDEMYASSAALVRHLCTKYDIPMDRAHIIAHGEVPHPSIAGRFGGSNGHTDPGTGWDWDRFMALVRETPGGTRSATAVAEPEVPAAPSYAATFVAANVPTEIPSGKSVVAWLEFRNDGTATWSLERTLLAAGSDNFRAADNWPAIARPSGPDHSDYSTGRVGRFSFVMTAPYVTTRTTFTETFELVHDETSWFGPDSLSFPITVVPPTAPSTPATPETPEVPVPEAPASEENETPTAPATPEPADEAPTPPTPTTPADPDEGGDERRPESRADDGSEGGSTGATTRRAARNATIAGGCSATGGESSGTFGLIAAAVASVVLRRRAR